MLIRNRRTKFKALSTYRSAVLCKKKYVHVYE